MLVILARRLALTILTMIAVLSVVFVLVHASGDPLDGFLAPGASAAVRDRTREHLGLDASLSSQYLRMLRHAAFGDFGVSWRSGQPALRTVLERLPATLLLAGCAIVIAALGGLAIGILAATSASRLLRTAVLAVATTGQAVPAFWLGTLGIMFFAVHIGWLPSSGNHGLRSLILPALTLAAYPGSLIARVTMASIRDVLHRPFVTQAYAKGLSPGAVTFRHVLPNALLPALAIVGVEASFLVGGAIVVESVFAYPGVGRLALQATADRDLPLIQAFVVTTVALVGLINAAVDTVGAVIDPAASQGATLSGGRHG